MDIELVHKIANDAIRWAKDIGEIQLSYFRKEGLVMSSKTNASDIVTVADTECERYIKEKVKIHYPEHSFVGEEEDGFLGDSGYNWIVDPIDGTNNYSQGLPIFCVSIAVQYNSETIVGVVLAPYLGELFTAIKNEGAYLNGERIFVGNKQSLKNSLLASEFPYDKDVNPDNNIDNTSVAIPLSRSFRCLGSAAYDLCSVAAGWNDVYWEMTLKIWDIAAGVLIVQEAGGVCETFRDDRSIALLATNNHLLEYMRDIISNKK